MKKNPRLLFKPKLKVLAKQCVSCPFGACNDFEFGDVLNKLRAAEGLAPVSSWDKIAMAVEAKKKITEETRFRGDFACHHSVYDSTGDKLVKKDPKQHRQCPGALKNYRKAK